MSVEFLWGDRAAPTRGPKPALSLAAIADAAIAVADAEGLAAVSMQRVAGELGFTKMSLYRYLPGKAELVALMVERAIGEPPELRASGWREALAEWSELLYEAFLRHPWTMGATVGSRPLGPRELGWMECALARLGRDCGLTGAERLDAVAVLAGHARMLAQQADARMNEAEMTAAMGEVMRQHGDRFPYLTAAMTETATGGGQNLAFAFGLDRILDGLESLIDRRTGRV
ncbi:TetR/AcrR family transcriptional regulator C-terminal domain-containing protein [Amorphoplanes digitatis]|uniref:AcrR family transcriptional regulator n=1 Tax=Actinoplanes digitatis TaxID=1868 RepID=A0A7W7HUP9_9ACTN|nr:TetR/AcrR family transcriptional regulator C-terminal domain-containing protein [Actinoplanes digitatis]MBB4761084.1 AcrR family transcriptional regulator [Actinoplanes digitatis]GID92700.1 TetR family transcriptional regulator [Actinoplanes digitatis]